MNAYLMAAALFYPCPTPAEYDAARREAFGSGEVSPAARRVVSVVALCMVAEGEGWLDERNVPWDWDGAVRAVRAARERCEGCPPLERSYVLPPPAVADAGYYSALAFRSKLRWYAGDCPDRELGDLVRAIAECDRSLLVWEKLRWCRWGSIADRRVALRELEDVLGEAALVGDVPPPIPPWALERWGYLP